MVHQEHIEPSNDGQTAGTDEGRTNAEVISEETPQGGSYQQA
jgi:hypothetical protein